MITYELAKRLKDAGFPQKKLYTECPHGVPRTTAMNAHAYQDGYPSKEPHPECADGKNAVYIPSLEELIDACMPYVGTDHFRLNWGIHYSKGWVACIEGPEVKKRFGARSGRFGTIGISPKEAVANLYIKLHETIMSKPIPFTRAYNRMIVYWLMERKLLATDNPEGVIAGLNRIAID